MLVAEAVPNVFASTLPRREAKAPVIASLAFGAECTNNIRVFKYASRFDVAGAVERTMDAIAELALPKSAVTVH